MKIKYFVFGFSAILAFTVSGCKLLENDNGKIVYITTNVSNQTNDGTHRVTFYPDNGDNVFIQIVMDGDKLDEPKEPIKESCRFIGWYSNSNVLWDFSNYTVKNDFSLTAKYEESGFKQSLGLETEKIEGIEYVVGIGDCRDDKLMINMPIAEFALERLPYDPTEIYLGPQCSFIGNRAFGGNNFLTVFFLSIDCDVQSDIFSGTWDDANFMVYALEEAKSHYDNIDDICWQISILDAHKITYLSKIEIK